MAFALFIVCWWTCCDLVGFVVSFDLCFGLFVYGVSLVEFVIFAWCVLTWFGCGCSLFGFGFVLFCLYLLGLFTVYLVCLLIVVYSVVS